MADESQVESLLRSLIEIDSVTPWLIKDGAGEGEVARYMRDWLADVPGVEISLEEVEPDRPNLVARLPGSGGGRSLCLNAHSDTVGYAGWRDRARTPRRDGDRLYGIGAADDKSCCAIGLLVMREIALSGRRQRGDLVVACTIDEEGSSVGTTDLVKRHRFDGAIVLEPGGIGRTIVEHQGFGWIDILVHGRAAHGSTPDEGIDAIVHASEVVRALAALDAKFAAHPDPVNGRTVLHTGTIRGGTDYATYPSECVIGIEIGTQPGETLAARVADIEAIFAECRSRLPDFSAEVRVQVDRDPFKAAGHEALLASVESAHTAVLGGPGERIGLNAWTDAALMQAAGIPTVEIGPLGGNFHAPDEWVSIGECVQIVDILRRAVEDFCA